MNWYVSLKTAMLKTAAPLAPVRCPWCAQEQVVDVGQRPESSGTDPVGHNGVSITRCPNCRKFIFVQWQEQAMNIARTRAIRNISNEEAMDMIRFDGIALVVSTKADHEEYQDLLSITAAMPSDPSDASDPIKQYEPATAKRPV